LVLLVFIPLYPKFPLANFTGTFVALRLDDIVIAISLFVWFLTQIKSKFNFLKFPITKLFIVYFISIFISFIQAYLIFQTEPTNILILHLLRRFEYISLFFIAITSVKFNEFSLYFKFLIITNIFIAFYGYGQKYFQFPVVSTMNSEFSKGQLLHMDIWTRISSTFAGHYDLAVYLSIILILIGGVIVTTKNIYLKLFLITNWLVSFHLLTLTASRVSNFAFLGGIVVTLILLRKFLWVIPVCLIFAFSLVNSVDLKQRLLATVPSFKINFNHNNQKITPTVIPTITQASTNPSSNPNTPPTKVTPIPTIIRHGPIEEQVPVDADTGVTRSGEIRFKVEWPRAITAFKKNILFGTGLGSISLATDNDYLRLLGESGLFGFLSFLGIFCYFIISSIKPIINKNIPITIFFGALLTFLLNATLIDAFEASKTAYLFWIMMGFYFVSLNQYHVKK